MRFTPIYGYGWAIRDQGPVEEPPAFTVAAEPDAAGLVQGQVAETNHILTGLWVVLAPRHRPHDGHYTVEAFREQPDDLVASVTGFATPLP
jgi:hypothetical protein